MQKNTLNFFMTVLLGMLICVMFARCDSNSSSGDPADCVGDECEEECVGAECDVNPIEDADGDTIADGDDNCPAVFNTQQTNSDTDALGDSCDLCPTDVDETNADTDADGTGDACDDDADNDGVLNTSDNCDTVANPEQTDADGDSYGKECDADDNNANIQVDDDKDGIDDTTDNCLASTNADQCDTDHDGKGNTCDTDDDDDGLLDDYDTCALDKNSQGYCFVEGDTDGDEVGDSNDNCPSVSNKCQEDSDSDGVGDACVSGEGGEGEADTDGDGILDSVDNCDDFVSTVLTDTDADGMGDVCDTDDDNDGVLDDGDASGTIGDNICADEVVAGCDDNCQLASNATQYDEDENGIGDACEDDYEGTATVTTASATMSSKRLTVSLTMTNSTNQHTLRVEAVIRKVTGKQSATLLENCTALSTDCEVTGQQYVDESTTSVGFGLPTIGPVYSGQYWYLVRVKFPDGTLITNSGMRQVTVTP